MCPIFAPGRNQTHQIGFANQLKRSLYCKTLLNFNQT